MVDVLYHLVVYSPNNWIQKIHYRYFSSILKTFRVIGAVLEQIESLHKTELGTSRERRAFPVCLCSVFCFHCLFALWEPNDRLHGIPGQDLLKERAGQRRRKGAGSSCRENGRSARLLQLCRRELFAHTWIAVTLHGKSVTTMWFWSFWPQPHNRNKAALHLCACSLFGNKQPQPCYRKTVVTVSFTTSYL